MRKTLNAETLNWMFGSVLGIGLALTIDQGALVMAGRWVFGWLIEPYSRLLFFGALCG